MVDREPFRDFFSGDDFPDCTVEILILVFAGIDSGIALSVNTARSERFNPKPEGSYFAPHRAFISRRSHRHSAHFSALNSRSITPQRARALRMSFNHFGSIFCSLLIGAFRSHFRRNLNVKRSIPLKQLPAHRHRFHDREVRSRYVDTQIDVHQEITQNESGFLISYNRLHRLNPFPFKPRCKV